jgi:membrane carboxypeptidase/penicillin-binding protein
MRTALAAAPADDFPQPATVVTACIDPQTGYLATAECPHQQDEFYLAGSEPVTGCSVHETADTTPAAPGPANGDEQSADDEHADRPRR